MSAVLTYILIIFRENDFIEEISLRRWFARAFDKRQADRSLENRRVRCLPISIRAKQRIADGYADRNQHRRDGYPNKHIARLYRDRPRIIRGLLYGVRPRGIEPRLQDPQSCVLSVERRAH